MKKTVFTLAIAIIIGENLMMSCKSPTKEEKESQEKVVEAKKMFKRPKTA